MNDRHLTSDELVDYLHGELPVAQDAAAATHLAACVSCVQARDAEAELTDMLRVMALRQERTMPSTMAASILDTAQRPQPRLRGVTPLMRPAFLFPVAVAAALLIWFGVRTFTAGTPKTTIAASYFVNQHAMLSAIAPFADDAPIPAAFADDNASR
jgi:anti-sigma factor RsiW